MDFTIHEDELEHDRILLERNLQMQHTETSFRLSSPGGNHDEDDELEYARHGSMPSPEFNFRDRNRHTDEDGTQSHLHMWSYRTTEDDEGVNPYGGESMSTVGHHASAVTLTAGLAGARSRRGADASHSGAEYDPDRPIDAMIAGVEKLSMFDTTESSKSRYTNKNMTFDPLIVDSTAELDRVLQSGHQPPPSLRSRDKSSSHHSRSVRLRSSHSSSTSSDNENDHANVDNNRPKLSDALRRVSFSPQRPRSPHSMPRASSSQFPKNNISGHTRQPPSPLARMASSNFDDPILHDEADAPTPKPARRAAFTPSDQFSYPRSTSAEASNQPQVRLHPATPSTSSLAKSVRGKASNSKRESSRSHRNHKEETEYNRAQEDVARPSFAPLTSRHVPNHRQATPLRKSSLKVPAGTPRFGKVQLPDVTGLTSAVESPAKMLGDEEYMSMAGLRVDNTAAREVEARLIRTLNAVQSRIEHLEGENSISRRRVRELEYELEECKRDVVRERTKLLEETAELSGVIHAASIARALGKKSTKGKGKAKESHATAVAVNLSAAEERYREVVEEKKALEALISSLRTHLARLTSELSEHQTMLMELRSLREKDAIALREKLAEVDNLRNEVERLAGEVEVLRGVVEEGLRERRRSGREVSIDASVGPEDRGMSVDENDESVDQAEPHVDTEKEINASDLEDSRPDNHTNTVANDDDPWSIDGSSRANTTTNPVNNENDGPAGFSRTDRMMRTDRASLGPCVPPLGLSTASNGSALTTHTNAARANTSIGEGNSFLGEDEKSRIEAEIEERRSIHGSFDASRLSISPRPRLNSPTLRRGITQRRTAEDTSSDEEANLGRETRTNPTPGTPPSHSQIPPRAPAPTPFHATVGADASLRREVDDRQPRSRRTSDEPRRTSGKDGCETTETPFPRIRGEYLERLFFSAPEHDARTCRACTRRRRPANAHTFREGEYNREYEHCVGESTTEGEDDDDTIGQLLPSRYDRFLKARNREQKQGARNTQRRPSGSGARRGDVDDEGFADASSEEGPATVRNGEVGARDKGKQRAAQFEEVQQMAKKAGESGLPPQTVVTRVIRELEDDFTHYKSIYCELADRYKEMDAVSEVRRRNILAKHLKEVVDILEQKGDQIASLYDLLSFKDKPLSQRGWSRRT